MKQRLILIISATLFMALSAHAQGIPTSIGGLSLSTSIDNPQPGQQVTIEAQSYSADINSSKLTWTVDGKVVKSDIGANTLAVTAPALGKRLTVNITMATASGSIVQDSIAITSGAVDLIVETSGYVPPFFLGKIVPVYQNAMKIVAVPHLANASGIEYDPKTLVYDWREDQSLLQDQSGYAKQSVTIGGDLIPRSHDIDVTVSTRDGSAQAEGLITIDAGSPSISFYIDDPLYGPLFNRAVGKTLRIGSQRETSVLAVPFGFDKPASSLGDLALSWSVNDAIQQDLSTKDSIVLRAPDNQSGTSGIGLTATNQNLFLQSASNGFSAVFTSQPGTATSSVAF